jgi:hypothetical protein
MTKQDGGPAFPVEVDSTQPYGRQTGDTVWQTYGMTLRDYFAAKAMQSLIVVVSAGQHNAGALAGHQAGVRTEMHIARDAYAMADAMLKARDAT